MQITYMNDLLAWNPLVMPKYGMVGYGIAEIAALKVILPSIKVYLCDFHRQQSWSR